MTDHMLDDLTERDGWSVAICACGAESPPCPDATTAANFWGQHLLAVASTSDQPTPCEHYGALDFDDDGHDRDCLSAPDQGSSDE